MIIPITYIGIFLWLILLYLPENNYLRLFGSIFGFFLVIKTIGGETWLAVDASNNLSLITFSDGFQLGLGLIIFGFNTVYTYFMLIKIIGERNEQRANR